MMVAQSKAQGHKEGPLKSDASRGWLNTWHVPVMLNEVLKAIKPLPYGVYCDCTLGSGGHARAFLQCLKSGKLVCIDRDPVAVERFIAGLDTTKDVVVLNENFQNLAEIWSRWDFPAPDGILMDLGFSTSQVMDPERGFSFKDDNSLDMRYNRTEFIPTAFDIVNTMSESQLEAMFFRYGERGAARRLARKIVGMRAKSPIESARDLAELVSSAVGRRGKVHPATRVFLALRSTVNRELEALEKGVRSAIELLKPAGRIGVITYHSLEDRIVKQIFKRSEKGCRCSLPVDECRCDDESLGTNVYSRGKTPSGEEIESNPSARSARLRVFERGNQA